MNLLANTHKTTFLTYITDIITEEDTRVKIEKFADCVWFTFGGEGEPRFLIDSVDGEIRILLYKDGVEEPDVIGTDSIAGSY